MRAILGLRDCRNIFSAPVAFLGALHGALGLDISPDLLGINGIMPFPSGYQRCTHPRELPVRVQGGSKMRSNIAMAVCVCLGQAYQDSPKHRHIDAPLNVVAGTTRPGIIQRLLEQACWRGGGTHGGPLTTEGEHRDPWSMGCSSSFGLINVS